jgi:hypothetical protein
LCFQSDDQVEECGFVLSIECRGRLVEQYHRIGDTHDIARRETRACDLDRLPLREAIRSCRAAHVDIEAGLFNDPFCDRDHRSLVQPLTEARVPAFL